MPDLCPTARLLALTLDAAGSGTASSTPPDADAAAAAAAAAALLLTVSGTVLHMNSAAMRLLNESEQRRQQQGGGGGGGDDMDDISSLLTFTDPKLGTWSGVMTDFGTDLALGKKISPVRNVSAVSAVLSEEEEELAVTVSIHKLGPCPCCVSASDHHRGVVYFSAYLRPTVSSPLPDADVRTAVQPTNLNLLQETVNASFDALFTITSAGTIVTVNDAAVKLFGYSTPTDFIGKNISMICGGGHAERHDEYLRRYLETGVTRIMGKKREVQARRRDGSEFWVELGIRELKDTNRGGGGGGGDGEIFFCAFVKDLTEQKEHDREIRLRESLTQAVVDSSFDPMFQINEQGKICVVNKAAIALFGWTREEFLGSDISMICGGGHGPKHGAYMARYLKTGEKRIIGRKRLTVARRKDGTEFDIELGIQEVVSEGGSKAGARQERYFCGYVRDQTRQKLETRRLRKHESIIKDEFFGSHQQQQSSGGESPDKNLQRKGSSDGGGGGRRPNRPLRHAHTTMGSL